MSVSPKRPWVAAILTFTFIVTGCSDPTPPPNPTPPPTLVPSEDDNSAADTSVTTFNTSDGRTPARGNIDQSSSIRTVPRTEFIETIVEYRTDEFGRYGVTRISYPSIDSVENKGVPKTSLTSALEFYTDFLSTEILDSIAFDNYANYDTWVREVAPIYIAEEFFDEVVNGQKNGKDAGVIYNNYSGTRDVSYRANLIPVLLRDGRPRSFNKHIWGLKAEPLNGGIYIWGMGAATVMFDDVSYLNWDRILFGPGGEQLERMNDGLDQVSQFNFQVGLTLVQDGDSWKITEYSNSFNLNSADDMEKLPDKFVEWRNAIE